MSSGRETEKRRTLVSTGREKGRTLVSTRREREREREEKDTSVHW